jgi:DNA-binding NarL/FixJ family response regulator
LQITGVEEMLSQWHQGVVKIHRVELKGSRSSIDGGAMVLQITPAERAVLQLLADGNPTVDIANRLGLSERAMDTMLTTLLESMGAASHVEAVEDAQRRGLLSALDTEGLPATG